MPTLRPPIQNADEKPTGSAVAAWQKASLVRGEIAIEECLRSIDFGEAPRIGVLGDSGTGKTYAATFIVESYVRKIPGWAIVCDDKELRARFAGQERRDIAEIATRPPAPEPRVLVLRGDVRNRITVDPESVAGWAWAMSARGRPTLGVYDELTRACKNGRWSAGNKSLMPDTFGQGRILGIGVGNAIATERSARAVRTVKPDPMLPPRWAWSELSGRSKLSRFSRVARRDPISAR